MSEKYINASDLIKRFEKWRDDLNRQIEGSVDFPSTRYGYKICRTQLEDCMNEVLRFPGTDVRPVPPGGIGEMSDGYHTFNGLYYQRMVLFAALVKQNKDSAWKSHRHEDGELCFGGGWFIVGIDTPEGSYTYHYEDKDWDLFDCEELPVGKHWDGHTEDDVTRLLSLPVVRPVVYCRECIYDDNCFAQSILEEMSRIPFDKNSFFCADGERREGGADG